jgi:hypothetical protein
LAGRSWHNRGATPGIKVFLLLFLQKKKILVFFEMELPFHGVPRR